MFITFLSYSQPRDVYTTTSNGSWVNVLNWDIGTPDNDMTNGSDDIIITHNITLTDDLTLKSGTTLLIEGCDTLYVTGNVQFNNGSYIEVEPCAVLIIDGNVTNSNNSTNVIIDGKIIIGGNYDGGTGSELVGTGEMEIDGDVTTDGDGSIFGSETDCDSATEDCDNSDTDPLGDPLPITLVFFNGEIYDNSILLKWVTASEINNNYFEIEKFQDSAWTVIGTIDGSGNSSTPISYSYIDINPSYNYNIYRLKQIDFNGKYETFYAISVKYPTKVKDIGIAIYPNPLVTEEQLNIELIGFSGEEVLIVVIDVMGQVFYERIVMSHNNNSIIIISKSIPSGPYLVIGSSKKELYKKKLIVQ
jgi:hypothetical protein